MKKFLLLLLVGFCFAGVSDGYNAVSFNYVTMTTANTVYSVAGTDVSRRVFRIMRDDTDVYIGIGASPSSLNYSVLLTSSFPVYEINMDNYFAGKIYATCVTANKKVRWFRGQRVN